MQTIQEPSVSASVGNCSAILGCYCSFDVLFELLLPDSKLTEADNHAIASGILVLSHILRCGYIVAHMSTACSCWPLMWVIVKVAALVGYLIETCCWHFLDLMSCGAVLSKAFHADM